MNWKTIDSAPKDRPVILKTVKGYALAQWAANLDDEDGEHFLSFKSGWAVVYEGQQALYHDEPIEIRNPTHWAEIN